ncbi:MAG: hypothetical protein MJ252_03590 [archaeon]|nr:hypothetical protein [archaeon]
MNFSHSKNLLQGDTKIAQIRGISWSENNMRIAVATAEKKIVLYDENGNKKESFSTKPHVQGKDYQIREIVFSPDSTLLAIAQSDDIVFVYKLGSHWGDKKSICNKFEEKSPITCMVWSKTKQTEIFFGLEDGKIKCGFLKKNQSKSLYSNDGIPVVSIAVSPDGKFVISGHSDNTIYKYNLENSSVQKLINHTCVPTCLAWGAGSSIVCAGNDYKIVFYNDIGKKLQNFDYSNDNALKEFTSCKVSPSGEAIALGNFSKYFVFLYNGRKQIWESCIKPCENYYTVSAICWKPDGSALLTGNLLGSVDLFEACLDKTTFRDIFEVTYVSHSQVLIKNTETTKRLIIKPRLSDEIIKLNIYLDNFVVMFTKESLLVGDISLEKYSEIPWKKADNEKFDFSNTNVCMIYSSEGLALIEYGSNEILGYCPTEYIHSNLISCRLNYGQTLSKTSQKIIAYLADLNTICIQDLVAQQNIAQIAHDSKIDFLELNKSGTKLIFRDRKRHLFLYHIADNKKTTLLNFCGFVQWVPNSEVLVAQERKNLCVWYNVDDPDKVKIIPVKGDVEEIKRKEGKAEVIVEEVTSGGGGYGNIQTYLLDDGLIDFSTAVDENNLNKAVKILENLEMSSDTESHWKTLAGLAIQQKNLPVAERCYAAVGSYSKANYIKKVIKFIEKNKLTPDSPLVEARLLILDKQFSNAENLLLNNNLLDETIEILNELQKWDESVKIAEKYAHPEISKIKSQYYDWLITNDQLDKAAELKEGEDLKAAIELYINGGYPAKAANLVKNYSGQTKFDNATLEKIITNLNQVGLYEKSGELLEFMGHAQRSLDAYRQARCYPKAIEVAKKHTPTKVDKLEQEYADYLYEQKNYEFAIVHYLEAGNQEAAINASIAARKWEKAIELLKNYPNVNPSLYIDIGRHFEFQRKLDVAESYYLKSGDPLQAFNMYVNSGKWDKVEYIVQKYLKDEESGKILSTEAERFEKEGRLKEAEKLYIMSDNVDKAITMYKTYKQYENMIRLVAQYRKEFLKKTHKMIGAYLEQDKNFKMAEYHYIQAGEWKSCVGMYRNCNMWEDCLRVAKTYGTKSEVNELSRGWVTELPKDQQIDKLLSMGLTEAAIDIYIQNKDFPNAFKLAEQREKYKIPEIHLKYAFNLEEEKNYHEAEDHYIKANAVQEAIQMYEHIGDFTSALRIARQHDQASVYSIYFNNGKYYLERGDLPKAEKCFVYAKQPEYMVKYYLSEKNYQAALDFATKNCPELAADLRNKKLLEQTNENMTGEVLMDNAKLLEQNGDYPKAIDTYLEITEKHFGQPDKLEEIWNRAVQLAMQYDKARAADIANEVGMKLMKIQKYQSAATLFESVGNLEDAITCHCKRNNFDRAKKIVSSMKMSDTKDKLVAQIDRAEKEYMIKAGDTKGLVGRKDEEGVKMLMENGEYEKCLDAAKEISPEMYNKYIIQIVKKYLDQKNLSGTADFLERYETPIYEYNLKLYNEIAMEILADENLDELKSLNNMLKSVNKQLVKFPQFKDQMPEMQRLNRIAYYQYLKYSMKPKKEAFPKSYYRVCQTVLGFGDIIKFDVALLDAGLECRDQGFKSNAFVLLNRFLDVYEVIKDPSAKLEEEANLKDTELAFFERDSYYKSNENVIPEDEKEKIVSWLIDTQTDKSFQKALNTKGCPKCKKQNYEANTYCHFCNYQFDICVITGFPIYPDYDIVSCSNCGRKGIKEAWREWVGLFQTCPNCLSVQMSYK